MIDGNNTYIFLIFPLRKLKQKLEKVSVKKQIVHLTVKTYFGLNSAIY